MCLEDYRIGRKMRTAVRSVQVNAATPTVLATYNASRVALTFSNTQTQINIAPTGIDLTVDGAFAVSGTLPPLVLDIKTVGDVVTKPWQAVSVGGVPFVLVIETFLDQV